MINPLSRDFLVIFGHEVSSKLFEEKETVVKKSINVCGQEEYYNATVLTRFTRKKRNAGYECAEIVHGDDGWYAKNTFTREVLVTPSKLGATRQKDSSMVDSIKFAEKWQNERPSYRYVWVRREILLKSRPSHNIQTGVSFYLWNKRRRYVEVTMITEDNDNGGEWIEWSGGDCPVPMETIVDIKFGNGITLKGIAKHWNWNYSVKKYSIVAYRIHEKK